MSESPIIHFIRSVVLLAVLIAVPGIAICWNHLPKNLFYQNEQESNPVLKNNNTHLRPFDFVEPVTNASAFAPESAYSALPESTPAAVIPVQELPETTTNNENVIQQVSWEKPPSHSNRNFEFLEHRLKELGAKYYRLEKWGNRGELFRFSCFVTPLEPLQYEKCFQAIGADEFSVMESVIADIERWKNPQ